MAKIKPVNIRWDLKSLARVKFASAVINKSEVKFLRLACQVMACVLSRAPESCPPDQIYLHRLEGKSKVGFGLAGVWETKGAEKFRSKEALKTDVRHYALGEVFERLLSELKRHDINFSKSAALRKSAMLLCDVVSVDPALVESFQNSYGFCVDIDQISKSTQAKSPNRSINEFLKEA